MKQYTEPELTVVALDVEDVVTTSTVVPSGPGDNNGTYHPGSN